MQIYGRFKGGSTLEFSWSSGREPIVMTLDFLCTRWVSVESFSLSGADLLVIDTFVLFLLVLLLDGIINYGMLLRGKSDVWICAVLRRNKALASLEHADRGRGSQGIPAFSVENEY